MSATDPDSQTDNAAHGGRLACLVGRYATARRACRPQVGDRIMLRRHSYSEVIEITDLKPGEVEYKKDCYHDNGQDWEVWKPKWTHLQTYRKRTVLSIRREGCVFVPANSLLSQPKPE